MSIVALLAPIPLAHLRDALAVCEAQGRVAFGSRAWEIFRELDEERGEAPVDAFIYASHDPDSELFEISWRGRYSRQVPAKNGGHPDGMRFRPASTSTDPSDNKGHWAIFWELDRLRPLSPAERIATSRFIGYKTGRKYKKNFAPEGLMIVTRP
jgi:hypothetical protein